MDWIIRLGSSQLSRMKSCWFSSFQCLSLANPSSSSHKRCVCDYPYGFGSFSKIQRLQTFCPCSCFFHCFKCFLMHICPDNVVFMHEVSDGGCNVGGMRNVCGQVFICSNKASNF